MAATTTRRDEEKLRNGQQQWTPEQLDALQWAIHFFGELEMYVGEKTAAQESRVDQVLLVDLRHAEGTGAVEARPVERVLATATLASRPREVVAKAQKWGYGRDHATKTVVAALRSLKDARAEKSEAAALASLRTYLLVAVGRNLAYFDMDGVGELRRKEIARQSAQKVDQSHYRSKAERKACAWCGLPGEKRCAQCGAVVYCGAACQKEHWKKGGHKKECRARTELQEKMRAATAPFRRHDDAMDAELRAKIEALNLRQLSAAGVRAACEETDVEQFQRVFETFKEEMLETKILGKILWQNRYLPFLNWGGLSEAQIQRKFDSGHRGLYCVMSSVQYREFLPRLRTTPKGRPMVAPEMTIVDFDDLEAMATTEGPAFESTLADCGGDREAAEAKTRAYREDIKPLRIHFANLPSKRTHFVCKFSDPDSGPYADATFAVPYSDTSSSSPFRTI